MNIHEELIKMYGKTISRHFEIVYKVPQRISLDGITERFWRATQRDMVRGLCLWTYEWEICATEEIGQREYVMITEGTDEMTLHHAPLCEIDSIIDEITGKYYVKDGEWVAPEYVYGECDDIRWSGHIGREESNNENTKTIR